MIIEIMSRTKIKAFSFKAHDEKVAVISISDMDKEAPILLRDLINGIFRQLKVNFADVDRGDRGCITDEQANQIANYVFEICKIADRIIINCEAGVSRSAGVGAALMKFFIGDDGEVFNSPRFRPNMTCYRKVLNALYALTDTDNTAKNE
jgi:predicted protein tyrosine phosphatase